MFVVAFKLNVAVIAGLFPVTLKLHGLVVEVQPEMLLAKLHPLKKEPVLAVAVRVPVALLLFNERLEPVHEFVNVHELMLAFVPPHAGATLKVSGFAPVVVSKATYPVPVPAIVSMNCLASVNVVCAVEPAPVAVR